ncbi:12819_t:CDS:1 [Acaulospora morrowiae]|uniref:12819_t:CDS:1 n=1 Tax=Acaulospora morrowiae TaxID=94023 RepID=A0A9N9CVQ9_9GLOM|nr:12819_t:CDS:1 [Acaulospora morrowiae]
MNTPFLKTYYRRNAYYLSREQIEEIRRLKNKVPIYKVIGDYHIYKEHILDIWNNCKRLQQGGNYRYTLETLTDTSNKQIKKKKSRPKLVQISDSSDVINKGDTSKDPIKNEITEDCHKVTILPTEELSSEDVLNLFKRTNSDIEKIGKSGHALRP